MKRLMLVSSVGFGRTRMEKSSMGSRRCFKPRMSINLEWGGASPKMILDA